MLSVSGKKGELLSHVGVVTLNGVKVATDAFHVAGETHPHVNLGTTVFGLAEIGRFTFIPRGSNHGKLSEGRKRAKELVRNLIEYERKHGGNLDRFRNVR